MDDPITYFIVFDNVCTVPFFSLVFLKFWDSMKKCPPDLLWDLISDKLMHCCGFSVSFLWRDSAVLHLDGLHSSLKMGVLHPMFVLFILLAIVI